MVCSTSLSQRSERKTRVSGTIIFDRLLRSVLVQLNYSPEIPVGTKLPSATAILNVLIQGRKRSSVSAFPSPEEMVC